MREQTGWGWVRRPIVRNNATPNQGSKPDPPFVSGTLIDQGAEFEGILHVRETFHISSEFHGEIVGEARVIVGKNANIKATIRAREVIILGAVLGDVYAARQLVLGSGARLLGNVEAPCIEMEKGAVFNGHTTMVRPEHSARTSRENERSPALPEAHHQHGHRATPLSTAGQPPASIR